MAKKAAAKGTNKGTTTRKKRRVSSKRGSPGQSKGRGGKAAAGKSVEMRGVAGIAVLCIGLLALLSQFIYPSGGSLINGVTLLTRGLGGTLCLLLPVMLCIAGVTLVFFDSGRMRARTIICLSLIHI